MELAADRISHEMVAGASKILQAHAPDVRAFAALEFKKIAATVATIEQELKSGRLDEGQARQLLEMQLSATRSSLVAAEGLGLVDVEEIVRAGLTSVRQQLNGALGFMLI
jgi:hypothetical protein